MLPSLQLAADRLGFSEQHVVRLIEVGEIEGERRYRPPTGMPVATPIGSNGTKPASRTHGVESVA